MGKDGFAQCGIGEVPQHRNLNRAHDFACFDSKGCEAENSVAVSLDEALEKSAGFHQAAGAQNRIHGNFGQPVGNSLLPGFGLAQPDAGELRISEKTKRHRSSRSAMVAAEDVVAHNAEIVFADMGEMRTTGDFADRPDARGGGLKTLVHPELLGIGLDQSTSITVHGDTLICYGPRRAAIWDGKDHQGKGYYYLRTGDSLNLATRIATLVPHAADP
jgi:hypothetical protein